MLSNLPKMGRSGTFLLNAAILAVFLDASAVPTPVYPLYQSLWGFPPVTNTVNHAYWVVFIDVVIHAFGQ